MTPTDKIIEARARAIFQCRWPLWNWEDDIAATRMERGECIDEARATLAADTAAGFWLAPMEATEEMIYDAAANYDYPSVYMGGPSESGKRLAQRMWPAMRDAARRDRHTQEGK